MFSRDPATCRELYTPALLEQNYDRRGAPALRACEEDAVDPEAQLPEQVTVAPIDVDGDKATADVRLVGSLLDGQTLTMKLLHDGDVWKIDHIDGFAELDREKLLFEMGREMFDKAETAAEVDAYSCALRKLEALSAEQIEALLFESSQEAFDNMFRICTPRAGSV